MSRSNPNSGGVNPTKHYFDWTGKKGMLKFYDKEKKANVLFPTLKFIVLEGDLNTVVGFRKGANGGKGVGIRGTEVRNLKQEEIQTWIGKDKGPSGLYEDLKHSVNGLKFAKPVYVAILTKEGGMEIAKVTMHGSMFGAWVSFLKGEKDYQGKGAVDMYSCGIAITGKSKAKKNGDTTYYEPVFETFELTDEQEAEALELDKKLQEYLKARSGSTASAESDRKTSSRQSEEAPEDVEEPDEIEDDVEYAQDLSDLPF